jgi:prolyl-tRNA editing enzyme YbaK/EbsC (Cys-tRNA(Pro) deacylase)
LTRQFVCDFFKDQLVRRCAVALKTTVTSLQDSFPRLSIQPALDHAELMAPATFAALEAWASADSRVAATVAVAEIDPALSDTAALTTALSLALEDSINCVVVAGRREGLERVAAAVVRADTRADVNNVVKLMLDVRKASFLPTEEAVRRTGMEYGGITPLGLPASWRVLVDSRVVKRPACILGAGVRRAKLVMPGELLRSLPGAEIVDNLAIG